ncbi:Rossmann-like and DUF2520 domain-containing protein [Pedobacter sp. SYP-B3415]|uniref:Rossmann-like and DUF2520 domain-containing protein n=1 Tax=Pedobacter sp. SYP-B3415 TaxID=2496641 RepID=UPI00101C11BD|nr:DUF2520 domain-containing protein [Pedobacter sp. SYP-B3415]
MEVVIAGSGNVATHLARALYEAGIRIRQIWSPTQLHAEELARTVDAEAVSAPADIDRAADLYILAVKDEAIETAAAALAGINAIVVHTSGTTLMNVLNGLPEHGVFYPLQTFSKARAVDFSNVPICIEAGSPSTLSVLQQLAYKLSTRVFQTDSEQRKALHVAAVFANNFTNHLFHIAEEVLAGQALPFDILRPLILETAAKVQTALPAVMQTGPARRNDQLTIDKHLEWLQDKPEWAQLYDALSTSIKKTGK